jgi:MSHA type pilus biogenesis protein MshL
LINVNQNNPVDFWKDLDEELSKLVTEAGKATLAINKTSGIIEVSDRPSAIKRVERFLASLSNSVHRQVEIEVKMYDVTLRDQFEFGINWERLARAFGGQFTVAGDMVYSSTATGINPVPGAGTLPIPGTATLPNTSGLTGRYQDAKTDIAVKALQEQGDVKVISQPRIRVINNQTALIKVGTDTPFFSKNVQTIGTGFGTATAIAVDSYQLITIGTILSLTPQISSNNVITLDVSPVITTLVNTHVSASGETTAPEMEIKQASSIVRLNDGETIVLGGLIQNRNVKNTRRIPLISDIPGFGQLFTGRMNQKEKRELVMFITPRIIKN